MKIPPSPIKVDKRVQSQGPVFSFSLNEVGAMFNIPSRKLRYWVEEGLIVPKFGSFGRGNSRGFGIANLIQFLILNSLTYKNVGQGGMKKVLEMLEDDRYFEYLGNPNREGREAKYVIVDDGGDPTITKEFPDENQLLKNGDMSVVVILLSQIEKCVMEKALLKN